MKEFNALRDAPTVLRRNLSIVLAHRLIDRRDGDRFIVSFPRSGSTWLRTILSGILDPTHGYEPEIFNRSLPGVSGRNVSTIRALPAPRLMSTHSGFRAGIPRAVYLVRDGRDSLISFYHYTTTRNGVALPFDRWFALYRKRWYGLRWHEHVEGWLTQGPQMLGNHLMIVKFEHLKAQPIDKVQEIAAFLGLDASQQAVTHAVEMASLDRAREREKKQLGAIVDPDKSFYRGGRSGQYGEHLAGKTLDQFMNMSSRALSLAGYDS